MSASVTRLGPSISCHAWNADASLLAVCPGSTEVHVYSRKGDDFEKEHTLHEHDKLVTGIDWAPKTNRIVTCGQDRNAYVWKFVNGQWKPTLVILRINRAATSVKWSPNEDKFAVGSGAKCVSVCYFEEDQDWWVSKHIKKHDSTVLQLDWHPNNVLLATASSDGKCRVFSGFVRGVDKKPGETPYGSRLPFGELLAEYPAAGWVKSVSWDAAGTQLAYASHDSSVTIINVANGAPGEVQVVRHTSLPYEAVLFANENSIVAVGHDCYPREISRGGNGQWELGRNVDGEKKDANAGKQAGTRAAFQMFQNKVDKGQVTNQTTLATKHQNTITWMRGTKGRQGAWSAFSTSALDGNLVEWNL